MSSARIFLDFNSTAPLRPEALAAMLPLLSAGGNPASSHWAGRRARQALEDARDEAATLLDADPAEVVFTSGATEANNLAIFGLVGDPPGHLLASPVEHPSVVEPLRQLAARGFALEWLPATRAGAVTAEAIAAALRSDTRLVSVMAVNHETGAVVSGQWSVVSEKRPSLATGHWPLTTAFHTDAAQAAGKVRLSFHSLGVTALTASGHKFGGPPGVGVLLVKRGITLRPLFFGGHQQRGLRPGTESPVLAVGFSVALRVALAELDATTAHVRRLRERFLGKLRADAAPVVVNGDGLPHTLNVSFPGCPGDALLVALDLAGVACSTGSACSSGSLLPSPVLQALGVPDDVLRSAMRFSFAATLTDEEIDSAAERVTHTVARIRNR